MQKLTQVHRLLWCFASASLLHVAEAAHVDVALVDAEDQVVKALDGPSVVASVLRVPAVATTTATILLVGAVSGGVPGLAALKAQALCRPKLWLGAVPRGVPLSAAVPAALLPVGLRCEARSCAVAALMPWWSRVGMLDHREHKLQVRVLVLRLVFAAGRSHPALRLVHVVDGKAACVHQGHGRLVSDKGLGRVAGQA